MLGRCWCWVTLDVVGRRMQQRHKAAGRAVKGQGYACESCGGHVRVGAAACIAGEGPLDCLVGACARAFTEAGVIPRVWHFRYQVSW